ncbi:hypothetical protein PTSG_00575 [Salpingoeca rosetta]|uniref:Uncharacterized protein n=1 Tax=Salpingoeca rosetta (strain ATCC 50818 / BSB-021) TaxID=946362 RepID=F2TWV5_SALR5|nr:uncharacterized protein PTSG_00575 [Salpingoeca rosetta]EGD72551.1 hypothetical protein PTSG_00575 [Salpingoeca rosetta]|eukprot:XP_004999120.1 hypothetical protein PTSG_00575 [Salpingoeca rosetta]
MMKVAAVLVVAVAAVASAAPLSPSPPTYPIRWQATENIVLHAGAQKQVGTSVSHFDGPNNRTAITNATHSMYDTIITNWNENHGEGKVYYIRTYGGERHCQFWCPPTVPFVCDAADSLCSYDYKNKAKFFGSEVVDGVQTNKFYWTENLGPIPMNSLMLYTAANSAQPTPVRMVRFIHPFGKDIGNSTIDFSDFKAVSSFPESLFDLGPDAKYDCSSPDPADQCQEEAIKAAQHQAPFLSFGPKKVEA